MYTFIQQGSIKWIKIDSKTITLLQKIYILLECLFTLSDLLAEAI